MGRHFKAEVIENIHLSDTHSILKVSRGKFSTDPSPGQFYLLKTSHTLDPLLRRPFSILRWDERSLEFLIMLKGKGTSLLKDLQPGRTMDLLGPLGRGFKLPEDNSVPLIVAGGVGIASVYPLIAETGKKAHVFYGASSTDGLYLLKEIMALTGNIHISTDDGSTGFKGDIIGCLLNFLKNSPGINPVIYACGPEGMMNSLKDIMKEKGLKGYLSYEERMACGIGACLGCAIKTKKGYERVCKEGPVFGIEEL